MRAMILAAGRGERMRPLTDTTPKPLLPVGGQPLIVWHIKRLAAAGFRDIIINHAWLGEKIESALGSGKKFGVRLSYSSEPTPLETAGGIARALPFFQNRPFLVINGDVWCDWNPAQACAVSAAMAKHNALAWLLLVNNPAHNPEGDFVLANAGATPAESAAWASTSPRAAATPATLGAPRSEHPTTVPNPIAIGQVHPNEPPVSNAQRLTFAGIGIYHPALFTNILPDTPAPLAPLLRHAIETGRVIGSFHPADWVDVGTPERLQTLDQRLARSGPAR